MMTHLVVRDLRILGLPLMLEGAVNIDCVRFFRGSMGAGMLWLASASVEGCRAAESDPPLHEAEAEAGAEDAELEPSTR
jgi:hypothetical protein